MNKDSLIARIGGIFGTHKSEKSYSTEDAKLLAGMCNMTEYLRASNHLRYWYFFPNGDVYNRVSKYLLHKNGVKVKDHMSEYMFSLTPSLRVRVNNLTSENREFISEIMQNRSDAGLSLDEHNKIHQIYKLISADRQK